MYIPVLRTGIIRFEYIGKKQTKNETKISQNKTSQKKINRIISIEFIGKIFLHHFGTIKTNMLKWLFLIQFIAVIYCFSFVILH